MSVNSLILIGSGGLGGAEIQAIAQALVLKNLQKPVVLGVLKSSVSDGKLEVEQLATGLNLEIQEFPFTICGRSELLSELRKVQKQVRNVYSSVIGLTQVPAIVASLSRNESTSGVWQQRDVGINRFFGPLDNLAALRANHLISNSLPGAEYVNKLTFGLRNCSIIGNLPDPRLSYVSEIKVQNKGAVSFTCVANFSEIKGHKYLLEAWEEFVTNHRLSISDTELNLIGRKDSAFPAICQKLETMKSRSTVKIHSDATLQEIDEILSMSSAFVISSISEGRSNAVDRASTHGLVTIGSNHDSIKAQLVEDNLKLLCDVKDVKSFSEKMAAVYTDPGKFSSIGLANRNLVKEYFDTSIEKWEKFYRCL